MNEEITHYDGIPIQVDDSLAPGEVRIVRPNVLFDTVTGQYVSVSDSLFAQVNAHAAKRERQERLASGAFRQNHPTKRHRSKRRK